MFTAYINTQIMPNTWENETTVKPPTRPTFPHYPTLLAAGCVGDILELCSIHDQAALWPTIVSQQNAVCQSRTKPVPEWYHIQIKWVWVKLSNYPLMVNDNPSGASISTHPLIGGNHGQPSPGASNRGALKTRKISFTSYCTDLSD